jgi:hypothetical protein
MQHRILRADAGTAARPRRVEGAKARARVQPGENVAQSVRAYHAAQRSERIAAVAEHSISRLAHDTALQRQIH